MAIYNMASRLPVISMWQPWAQWVMLGWKTIETRLHDKFKSLEGKTIGIHAAMKWDHNAIKQARLFLGRNQIFMSYNIKNLGGHIICTADVKEHRLLTYADSKKALIDCEDTQRFGLILKGIESIKFIPIKGKQGIWYHEIDL